MPNLVLALLELLELAYLALEGLYERLTRSGDGDDNAEADDAPENESESG